MQITATHQIDNGLEYNEYPDIPLVVGETSYVDGYMKLFINGNLGEYYVDKLVIEEIDVEYVVNEKEWYVNYYVGHYKNGKQITVEKLEYEDIEDMF